MVLWTSMTPNIAKNGFQNYEIGNLIFYGQVTARARARLRACGVWCVCGMCACAVCMCVCVVCACVCVCACTVCMCVRVWCMCACVCVFLLISCETNGQILTKLRTNTAVLSSPLLHSLCPTINNPNKVNMRCSEERQY